MAVARRDRGTRAAAVSQFPRPLFDREYQRSLIDAFILWILYSWTVRARQCGHGHGRDESHVATGEGASAFRNPRAL